VFVVNASGVGGLARQAASALRAQGFVITGTGNRVAPASGTEVPSQAGEAPSGAGAVAGVAGPTPDQGVVVRYAPGSVEAARTLAAAFPGATVDIDTTLTTSLVVELGARAPSVVAVPNRTASGRIPAQPLTATTPGDTASLTARVATDASCSRD
jgi:hypothetical protein